jgi:anti-sigma factor RsiW
MRMNLSNRDWELLSAYMDGQLSSGKREQLEIRMQSDPELRTALDDLTQTIAMLRSLPRMKAPHTFRLTPEMVGQRQPRRLYPLFQFASALSSLMLVLVLLSDFLGFGLQSPFGQMASQAPEASVAAEVFVDSTPASLALEMPAEEQADARKVIPAEEGEVIETEQAEGLMLVEPLAPKPTAEADVYLAAPAPLEEQAPNLSMKAADVPPDTSAADELPAEMPAPALQVPGPEMDQATAEVEPAASGGFSGMRILQISLALVALSTAMAAIYLRSLGR